MWREWMKSAYHYQGWHLTAPEPSAPPAEDDEGVQTGLGMACQYQEGHQEGRVRR